MNLKKYQLLQIAKNNQVQIDKKLSDVTSYLLNRLIGITSKIAAPAKQQKNSDVTSYLLNRLSELPVNSCTG